MSATPRRVVLNGAGLQLNRSVLVDIVIEAGGDPYGVYHSAAGVRIAFIHYRPTSREVDEVRAWKAG